MALFRRSRRTVFVVAAVGVLLAVGIVYTVSEGPKVRKPDSLPGSEISLRDMVFYMAAPSMKGRDEGSEHSAEVRAFLIETMQSCGLEPAGELGGWEQRIRTGQGTNVLGRVRGRASLDGPYPLVSAHYDHQDQGLRIHPGAYDNAAAVASLLTLACRMAAEPPARDVLIAFWDAEEPPTFLTDAMGSQYYVDNPTVELNDISTAVVLDLMGAPLWPGFKGGFAVGAETSSELTAIVKKVHTTGFQPARAGLHLIEDLVTGRHQPWSDYDAFRNQHIPVLFYSDGQNKRYHTAKDTPEHIDFDRLHLETDWLETLIRAIADADRAPTWSPRELYAQDLDQLRPVLKEAADDPFFSKTARASLEVSIDELADISKRLDQGASMSDGDVWILRRATQKLMCWCQPMGSALTCGLL